MRYAGFALLAVTVGVTTALAQSPVVPATGAVQPPLPAAVAPPDQKLDAHLGGWEKTMGDLKNFRFDLELIRIDPAATGIFKGEHKFHGSVLCMKPNLARLRLDNDADPRDFEAFICNGKAVYAYNGLQKTITEHKLPDPKTNPTGATDNLILDFMTGMKARDLKDRFDLKLFKEDQYYIYLDIKPKLAKDKQDFQQLRLALYGPKTDFAYLPAQVYMVKPNGETEQWKLTKPMTNIPNLDPRKVFEYENVPGFRFQQAPDQKAPMEVRPGQPTPPVRSGRP
jgi:TIGR03009 family protein